MTPKRDLTTDILRLRWLIAAEQLELTLARSAPTTERLGAKCSQLESSLALRRLQLAYARNLVAFGTAGFNPAQPRVPAGHPDGGQWTVRIRGDAHCHAASNMLRIRNNIR
jgi:hypothetical protein